MIKTGLLASTLALLAAPALAQTADPHAGHAMPAQAPIDHSMMNMDVPPAAADDPMAGMDHGKMVHGSMNHGGMVMAPTPKGITRKNMGAAESALQSFSNALEVGNRDLAIARLAPDLKVFEDGDEEDYGHYVGGHLAADIAYQKTVKTILLERAVTNETQDRTRIVSKNRMISNRSDKMIDKIVDETALLSKRPDGWKIERIEWVTEK